MSADRYDVLVVGAGPAGSVAALVLARVGARVALVDKAPAGRDKACGDLVGPRAVQTLTDLGIDVTGPTVGDMEVVGPTGRRVLLPATPGEGYPGYAVVARRARLDAHLRALAVAAGAVVHTGRAATALSGDGGDLGGFELEREGARARSLTADVVIGADGALSRVGSAAGMVDDERVLWAFAVRAYVPAEPALPTIHFWEPGEWSGYPGYGWVFPGEAGRANVGLGVGSRGGRVGGGRPSRDLARFLSSAGLGQAVPGRTLGGWMKMGMVGTVAARGRTLLVGDAAGLVNALQGEGISQAVDSGRAAAEAFLAGGADGAGALYRAHLARRYAPYAAATAPVSAWMVRHPRAVAGFTRLVTAPGVGRAVSASWALYWNDLLDGARPGWPRRGARLASAAGRLLTAVSAERESIRLSLTPGGPARGATGTR